MPIGPGCIPGWCASAALCARHETERRRLLREVRAAVTRHSAAPRHLRCAALDGVASATLHPPAAVAGALAVATAPARDEPDDFLPVVVVAHHREIVTVHVRCSFLDSDT